jgi:hypothetical protein
MQGLLDLSLGGEDLGFEKVKVGEDEWKTLSYEVAKERCEGM